MLSGCIFCQIVQGTIPCYKVYEDDHVMAFFDINPVNEYHTLVITKIHYENIFDISEPTLQEVMHVIKKLTTLYHDKLGIHNIQLIQSSGKEAQQEVPHIHFHIIPRKNWDNQDIHQISHPELREKFEELLQKLQ